MKVRSKREAERLAYEAEDERKRRAFLDWMASPGEGYASVGSLNPLQMLVCLRCSAVVYGRDRHNAWHDSL